MRSVRTLMGWCLVIVAVCLGMPGCNGDDDNVQTGLVFAMTNAATGNEVIVFRRADDGTLTRVNAFPTGGFGTGTTEVSPATPQDGIGPLASQGSLALSRNGRFLFAVNAGSGTVSSFQVADSGALTRVDIEPSGGAQPNSLDHVGNLLYVSNVGNAANNFASNVTGFRVESDGSLTQIAGSTRALSTANAQPARVLFSRDGSLLIVTELTTNRISTFRVNTDGTLTGPTINASSGAAPFGAALLPGDRLLVAEASGALSSYNIGVDGTLTVNSGSIPSGQLATCWVVATVDGAYAYTSNTGSNTLSSYRISNTGMLTILQNVASTLEGPNSGPIDSGASSDGRYLYVLNGAQGSITALRIEADGQLTRLQGLAGQGLPMLGSQGLAVR